MPTFVYLCMVQSKTSKETKKGYFFVHRTSIFGIFGTYGVFLLDSPGIPDGLGWHDET